VSQFDKLEQLVACRNELADYYAKRLLLLSVDFVQPRHDSYSAWHLMIIKLPENIARKQVFNHLRKANIGTNVHYIPVHTQPYYSSLGFKRGDFPAAEAFYQGIVTLPLHPQLETTQVDYICDQLALALAQ
ncbi:DegT/DnrJ/EryC1/StrS family aminotransferase, partial [Shewanella sp. 0m-11]